MLRQLWRRLRPFRGIHTPSEPYRGRVSVLDVREVEALPLASRPHRIYKLSCPEGILSYCGRKKPCARYYGRTCRMERLDEHQSPKEPTYWRAIGKPMPAYALWEWRLKALKLKVDWQWVTPWLDYRTALDKEWELRVWTMQANDAGAWCALWREAQWVNLC